MPRPARQVGWRRPVGFGHRRPSPARARTELAALTDLVIKLRELRDVERRMTLEREARAAYLDGAEDHALRTLGRPLTADELARIVARYPPE
jgi:hypothetical protein